MKLAIKCGDFTSELTTIGEVTISDSYTGVVFATPDANYGICQRDGGIEVTDVATGKMVFSTHGLPKPSKDPTAVVLLEKLEHLQSGIISATQPLRNRAAYGPRFKKDEHRDWLFEAADRFLNLLKPKKEEGSTP